MPFLTPNQQRQSTEGTNLANKAENIVWICPSITPPPPKLPLRGGRSGPLSITWFLGLPRVHILNNILISSTVCSSRSWQTETDWPTDEQTDRQRDRRTDYMWHTTSSCRVGWLTVDRWRPTCTCGTTSSCRCWPDTCGWGSDAAPAAVQPECRAAGTWGSQTRPSDLWLSQQWHGVTLQYHILKTIYSGLSKNAHGPSWWQMRVRK